LHRIFSLDTLANSIWVYDYDAATRNSANARSFFQDFARGRPDGSAVDAEGYLNCRHGGGCRARFAPNGPIDRVIEMPV
jgi:sugar lactone lactonase YvrE